MTQYITNEGDRWDTISWKAYGSIAFVPDIIAENPTVPITDRLPGGIVLNLPVIAAIEIQVNSDLLPPWKKDL